MSKSQPSIAYRARAQRARAQTNSTHAQGIQDSAAVLITPNGSIRRTVMINPAESLPLRSVTCRGLRRRLLPCLTGGAEGATVALRGGLQARTRSAE